MATKSSAITPNGVPAGFTMRWRPNTGSSAPRSSASTGQLSMTSSPVSSTDFSKRKYNTSCTLCRKARVKCSGGFPCQRCSTSANPSSCAYSISQRRGKRKAGEPTANDIGTHVDMANVTTGLEETHAFDPISLDEWVGVQSAPWNSLEDGAQITQPQPLMLDQTWSSVDASQLATASPSLSEFLESLSQMTQPPPSNPKDRGTCSESCYIPVHRTAKSLTSLMDGPSQPRLDMALQLLDEAVVNAAKYMACLDCDAGCPRLMNLALLHQRQVNTLSEVAKSPATFLCDGTSVSFGAYRSCREDGLAFQRLVLLRIVRNVTKSIEEFQERAEDFQSRFLAGTLELGDAGKLNLKWLLDIGSNLARRLGCIKSILEKEDWIAEV